MRASVLVQQICLPEKRYLKRSNKDTKQMTQRDCKVLDSLEIAGCSRVVLTKTKIYKKYVSDHNIYNDMIRLTCQKCVLPLKRFPNWYRHQGNLGPRSLPERTRKTFHTWDNSRLYQDRKMLENIMRLTFSKWCMASHISPWALKTQPRLLQATAKLGWVSMAFR